MQAAKHRFCDDLSGFTFPCDADVTNSRGARCPMNDRRRARARRSAVDPSMIERAIVDFGVDRRRVFVTGLSAGGPMASVMLATYPEIFAGGAIIAGLPYGCAASVQEALEAMFQERAMSALSSPETWVTERT
jgi:poly(hydroxyalkanoate) depolymerase family esterase